MGATLQTLPRTMTKIGTSPFAARGRIDREGAGLESERVDGHDPDGAWTQATGTKKIEETS
jgi:hypothetical protein